MSKSRKDLGPMNGLKDDPCYKTDTFMGYGSLPFLQEDKGYKFFFGIHIFPKESCEEALFLVFGDTVGEYVFVFSQYLERNDGDPHRCVCLHKDKFLSFASANGETPKPDDWHKSEPFCIGGRKVY